MRDELVGYLMGALDAPEAKRVQARLDKDAQLRHEAELLSRGIRPLEVDKQPLDPPVNLLESTLAHIDQHGKTVGLSPRRESLGGGESRVRWSMADVVVAAGVCLAAVLLFFPTIVQSRYYSRLTACKQHQQLVYGSLARFSELNGNRSLPFVGVQDTAGIYGPYLKDAGLLTDDSTLRCPETARGGRQSFEIPTVQMVRNATGAQLAKLQREMGGDYAYVLGYVDSQGKLRPVEFRNRAHFALLADARDSEKGAHATGHVVTFEDGHVRWTVDAITPSGDDIFRNDQGAVAAGIHAEDSVLGSSATRPVPWKGIATSLTAPQ